METINYRNIGKIVAAHGLQGDLILLHQLGKKTSLKGLEIIFLELRKDEMLPYFIEKTTIRDEASVFIKLEGIDSKEAARKVLRREVWLKDEEFAKYAASNAPVSLVGYRVMNEEEDLGEILEVIEQPHHVLCRIDWKGKEALLPVNEETLRKMDKKKKILYLKLPDGLLDIYLD
jgi:16S rRNA processing protein RimM